MNAQRVGMRALRQVVARQPNAFFAHNLPRLALANYQTRGAATTKLNQDDAQALLAAQRKQRPVAPHLTAYDYSQTWFGSSIWTRITGSVLTGGLYTFSLAYLAAPLMGWHLESASLAAAVAGLPMAVKGGAKFLVAWPFLYHAFNGTRHLVWDFAIGFQKGDVTKGAWVIWGGSLLSALGIAFLL
ncbi:Uu.00g006730.m01.CDS01 [Anthostomella pinea]|uniref:Uu.00g006730.m01.CDS01 n=1 Tax=Anthostomella pinea TaxID=933095 RepID=A0AAI8YJ54_9PEZI|nr:Uu.00g006730.m01.CDS01 [Anthostomella pinea]